MDRFKAFIPVIIWIVVITILSGYPGNQLPKVAVWQFDKLVHTIMYGVLSFLLFLPFYEQFLKNEKPFKIRLVIILVGVFYGGFMEILQENIFINRSGNWIDFTANSVGAILGVYFTPLVLKFLPINRWLKIN
ncbi:MAG: VanZ family protein [Vicingaceae bacterium]